jgi:hypothetical protein
LLLSAVILAVLGGGRDVDPAATASAARVVGIEELVALEEALGHTVYWAGERPPARIELREKADGIYISYLPPRTDGDSRADATFLTVGTYPVSRAAAVLRAAAADADVPSVQLPDGVVAFAGPGTESSVYLAYPASDLQIEVYHPMPGRAMKLINSGEIKPVGE